MIKIICAAFAAFLLIFVFSAIISGAYNRYRDAHPKKKKPFDWQGIRWESIDTPKIR